VAVAHVLSGTFASADSSRIMISMRRHLQREDDGGLRCMTAATGDVEPSVDLPEPGRPRR
jgi:hypothetical protein